MLPAFHTDPQYPAPFPFSRSAESIDDEFSTKAVFAALQGTAASEKTSYMLRGWAILSAFLNPEKREMLTAQFSIKLPNLNSKKDYTLGCDLPLTWEILAKLFSDIPNPLPTDPYHAFFTSPAASFGLWESYVTLYHKHIAGVYQKENGAAIRTKLLAEKRPGVYVIELTHSDKEFPKGTLGTYNYTVARTPQPFRKPPLQLAGHTIYRKVKCKLLNYSPLTINEALLGDRSPQAYAALARTICMQPVEFQAPLWSFLAKNQPTISVLEDFIPYIDALFPYRGRSGKQKLINFPTTIDGVLYNIPALVVNTGSYSNALYLLVPTTHNYTSQKNTVIVQLTPCDYVSLESYLQ